MAHPSAKTAASAPTVRRRLIGQRVRRYRPARSASRKSRAAARVPRARRQRVERPGAAPRRAAPATWTPCRCPAMKGAASAVTRQIRRPRGARMASTSRATKAMSGSKPAATHALRTMPRADGATHGSPASLRQADGAPAREAMPGPDGDHERLLEQLVAAQPGCSRRGAAASWNRTATCRLPSATPAASSSTVPSTASTRWGTTLAIAAGTSVASALGKPPTAQRARGRRRARRAGRRPAPGARPPRRRARARPSRLGRASGRRARGAAAARRARARGAATCWETAGWVERQLARRGRERAGLRDGAEGEQPARIQHKLEIMA